MLETNERKELKEFLIASFNLEEFKDLSFNLGVDYQLFDHKTKGAFARGLIDFFDRRNKLDILVTEVMENRSSEILVRIKAKLSASSSRPKKYQLVVEPDLVNDANELKGQLASLFKCSPEDIGIIGASLGSMRLLISFYNEINLPLNTLIEDFEIENNLLISMTDFDSLSLVSQATWRYIVIDHPPISVNNILVPTISWEVALNSTKENILASLNTQTTEERIIIGTVVSDQDTPTFELVRIKLAVGQDVKPGTLLHIPVNRSEKTTLIARVNSAYENNPNERPEDINVRDTLGIQPNYPVEAESTTIFRIIEADLIEEIYQEVDDNGDVKRSIRSPQTLPNSGALVTIASREETVFALGLISDKSKGLYIGETISGSPTDIVLKREAIQRHLFICGTTGSGKSYAMGVLTEEILKHNLPVIFIDTQDEYSNLVKKLGGEVLTPGEDFTIRISSLTDRELVDAVPTDSQLQKNIISAAFLELQDEIKEGKRTKFLLEDLLNRIEVVGANLTKNQSSIELARLRTEFIGRTDIFGTGIERANWPKYMYPCLSIKCKNLTSSKLQMVATALLREFQDLRLREFIPPYVMVIDEAHLFVPQGESTPCKQIILEGVRIGRHHGISLALLTQSPVDIFKSAIRQCNTRFVFALEPDQLDAIRGVKADATDEMLRALPKMPQGTCLLSGTYESVKHTIPVKIRKRQTPDSEGGATPDIFNEMNEMWIEEIQKLKASA